MDASSEVYACRKKMLPASADHVLPDTAPQKHVDFVDASVAPASAPCSLRLKRAHEVLQALRMGEDRRRSLRKRFSHPARLFHPDGKPICGCSMRDISETGARIRISEPGGAQLPATFILAISKSGNVFRRCELIWSGKGEVGVRFARTT